MAKYPSGPKRPIDKENRIIVATSVGTSQDESTLRTSTVAETYTGGHIQLSFLRVSGGGQMNAVLAMVPEGLTIPTVATSDGNPIFTPEEFMLWSCTVFLGSSSVEPV